MNALVAIAAIAAGLVLAPVIAIMFVAVCIDTYNAARTWLASRRATL